MEEKAMSWQDDPVVSGPEKGQASGSWQNDPIVEAPKQIGGAESFTRGAANNFPLVPQAIAGAEALTGIGNEGGYSKNLEDWNAKAAAAKAANPKTYGTGAVVGALAPLAIPGVGEFMGANPILGNALYGAASGISNTDILKKPEEAAKEALTGGVIGGATAGAFKGLGKLGGAAAKGMGNIGNRLEANVTAQALDLNPRAFNMLARKMGGNANPETIALDINKNINRLFPNAIELSDTAATKFEKLSQAHDSASNVIGSVIEKTDKNLKPLGTAMPEVENAINQFKTAGSQYEGLASEGSKESLAQFQDQVTKLNKLKENGKLNFRNLVELKKDIGHLYNNPKNIDHAVDQIYSIYSDAIDGILDRTSVSDPQLVNDFNKAKEVFKFTSDILPAMQRGVTRKMMEKSGNLTNVGLGLLGFAHPAAWLALAGKTAGKLAYPELGENIAYKAINAARNAPVAIPPKLQAIGRNAPQAIKQELTDYLTSKYGQKGARQ
jgi:hypothetical protein